MKSRPSGEKRRKEMLRQERQREKAEKRKSRKEQRLEPSASALEGETGVVLEVNSDGGLPASLPLSAVPTPVSEADASSGRRHPER